MSEQWQPLLDILNDYIVHLRRLMNSSTTLTQSIASMDRMFELMDEKYDITRSSRMQENCHQLRES